MALLCLQKKLVMFICHFLSFSTFCREVFNFQNYLMPKVIKHTGIKNVLIRITHSLEQVIGEKYLYIQILILFNF